MNEPPRGAPNGGSAISGSRAYINHQPGAVAGVNEPGCALAHSNRQKSSKSNRKPNAIRRRRRYVE